MSQKSVEDRAWDIYCGLIIQAGMPALGGSQAAVGWENYAKTALDATEVFTRIVGEHNKEG